jgi:hypothetical protein
LIDDDDTIKKLIVDNRGCCEAKRLPLTLLIDNVNFCGIDFVVLGTLNRPDRENGAFD